MSLAIQEPLQKIRRSELICPGHSARMMAKAAASEADQVIFDLEDACAVSQKISARAEVIRAFRELDFGLKTRAFRVNGLDTPFFLGDLTEVVAGAGRFIDGVVVPKVSDPDQVRFVDRLLGMLEVQEGLVPGRIGLEVLIETARGIVCCEEIARASPRLRSLIFGIADYAGDIGAKQYADSDEFSLFHYPKSRLVAAAKAAGIDAIDNVTVHLRDLARVARDSEAGARLGFDGKWAIHPSHLKPIHLAYSPSDDELRRALRVVEAYARADSESGLGAIVIDDEMIDAATLVSERKKVALGRRIGRIDDQNRLIDA